MSSFPPLHWCVLASLSQTVHITTELKHPRLAEGKATHISRQHHSASPTSAVSENLRGTALQADIPQVSAFWHRSCLAAEIR